MDSSASPSLYSISGNKSLSWALLHTFLTLQAIRVFDSAFLLKFVDWNPGGTLLGTQLAADAGASHGDMPVWFFHVGSLCRASRHIPHRADGAPGPVLKIAAKDHIHCRRDQDHTYKDGAHCPNITPCPCDLKGEPNHNQDQKRNPERVCSHEAGKGSLPAHFGKQPVVQAASGAEVPAPIPPFEKTNDHRSNHTYNGKDSNDRKTNPANKKKTSIIQDQ